MTSPLGKRAAGFGAAAVLTLALAQPALAVTVQVNGNTVALNPPPTERAGRVFVPLRGVFENLGASVVYQAGQINATGRGHNVSLRIGSTQATVDGQTQTLDVAPFIIGASTYVPLRFVSQALGANVNWDGANQIVAITTSGGGQPQAYTAPRPPQNNGNNSPVRIGNLLPRRDATIQGNRPTIQATFENGTVDPNSVRVMFDQRDVTNRAYISPQGVTFTPRATLPAGQHTVQISGHDTAGATFDRRWSFTSGGGGSNVTNAIGDLTPAPGSTVPTSFELRGRTAPGSAVTVQVGVAQQSATNIGQVLGAILGVGGNSQGMQTTVTADGNGRFSVPVNIGAPSGSVLGVVITSTEPNYGVAAEPVRFNLRVQ